MPAPTLCLDRHLAAEFFHLLAYDGQPQATTRNVGDDLAGGDARFKDERERLGQIQFPGGIRWDGTCPDRGGLHVDRVDARTVIGHQDLHLPAVFRVEDERDRAASRFPVAEAHIGYFNAMVNTVPHKMDKRVFQFIQDPFVDLHLSAADDQVNFLTLVAPQVSYKCGKDFHQS